MPGKDQFVTLVERNPFTLVGEGGQLEHEPRLAREGTLVHAQGLGREQLGIRRDLIPLLEPDDVARDEIARGDPVDRPVADHRDVMGKERGEELDGAFRAVLLDEAEHAVDDDDREDGPGQLRHPSEERDRAADPEQHGEEARELFEEAQAQRTAADLLEPVRAGDSQAPGRLGAVQARRGGPEEGQHVVVRQRAGPDRLLDRGQDPDQVFTCPRIAGPGDEGGVAEARLQAGHQADGDAALAEGRREHDDELGGLLAEQRRAGGQLHPAKGQVPRAPGQGVHQHDARPDGEQPWLVERRLLDGMQEVFSRTDRLGQADRVTDE